MLTWITINAYSGVFNIQSEETASLTFYHHRPISTLLQLMKVEKDTLKWPKVWSFSMFSLDFIAEGKAMQYWETITPANNCKEHSQQERENHSLLIMFLELSLTSLRLCVFRWSRKDLSKGTNLGASEPWHINLKLQRGFLESSTILQIVWVINKGLMGSEAKWQHLQEIASHFCGFKSSGQLPVEWAGRGGIQGLNSPLLDGKNAKRWQVNFLQTAKMWRILGAFEISWKIILGESKIMQKVIGNLVCLFHNIFSPISARSSTFTYVKQSHDILPTVLYLWDSR